MPDKQTIHGPGSEASETPAVEPIEDDAWLEEPDQQELPRRPRRRLVTPAPLALLGVLLIAGGFISGVAVEKGQSSSGAGTAAPAGLASRFAALRSGSASSTGTASGSASGIPSSLPAAAARGNLPTAGTVAYLSGSTLYVTTSEGSTVKVEAAPSTNVTKTDKAKLGDIHPGETVTVTGTKGAKGAVSAQSISVGSSGGGLAALLGGSSSSGASAGGASGGAALFGSG